MVKVRALPLQPHCFAFGGFELQMLTALEAARGCQVDAQPMDIWSRDGDFAVLHVWGLDLAHLPAIHWARRAGKRVVMTALLPYLSVRSRLRHIASRTLGRTSWQHQMLKMVSVLVVVNDAQAETACRMLGMPRESIAVIPNVVEAAYFAQHSVDDSVGSGNGAYVLCTGNVCARKAQFDLANACLNANCPLTIIGDVLPGEERYGDAVARLIEGKPAMRWQRGLRPASPELVDAYRRCRLFALPSHDETQPISLLEAAAAGKPLLTGDRPYARQKYFRHARLVEPGSQRSIEQGLRAVLSDSNRYVPPADVLAECRKEHVGAAYKRAYDMALNG